MQKRSKEQVFEFMNNVESSTKSLLTRIRNIDSESMQKQARFHTLGSAIVHFKEHQKSSPNKCTIANTFDSLSEAMN